MAHLTKKHAYLLALAVATHEKNPPLVRSFTGAARREGSSDGEIAQAYAIASFLSTSNVYYRFKHFSDNKHYDTLQAGIKMTIMARPVLEKVFFESISLLVGAVNGCQVCVNSHEVAVRRGIPGDDI